MGVLIEISDQISHLLEAEMRLHRIELGDLDVVLVDDAFELEVVVVLGEVVVEELVELELDANGRGEGDLLRDVGEGGVVEAEVEDVEVGGGPLGVPLVEGTVPAVEGLVLLAFLVDLVLDAGHQPLGEFLAV